MDCGVLLTTFPDTSKRQLDLVIEVHSAQYHVFIPSRYHITGGDFTTGALPSLDGGLGGSCGQLSQYPFMRVAGPRHLMIVLDLRSVPITDTEVNGDCTHIIP